MQEAIDEIEANKVDKTSIVDNLTTNDATKVLSAKQGKALKDLHDDVVDGTITVKKAEQDEDGNNIKDTYATKQDLTIVYKYKGSVATYEDLPNDAENGDVYNVEADGKNYAWSEDEEAWDDLGGVVDLSGYVQKTDIVNNLASTDANKPLSAKQGKVLQDTKEALTNKAVDFSVVNDTKYPTNKSRKRFSRRNGRQHRRYFR